MIDIDGCMKKAIITALVASAAVISASFEAVAQSALKEMEIFSITDKVINSCSALDQISRDEFWKLKLNTLLEGKGKVVSVEEKAQFRRKYRITVTGGIEGKISLIYYIYTDNEDYKRILQPGSMFGFKGQFAMFTPLNSKRTLYLFDLILEEGAALVE